MVVNSNKKNSLSYFWKRIIGTPSKLTQDLKLDKALEMARSYEQIGTQMEERSTKKKKKKKKKRRRCPNKRGKGKVKGKITYPVWQSELANAWWAREKKKEET